MPAPTAVRQYMPRGGREEFPAVQSDQFELHARIEREHWWFVARRQIVRRLVEELVPPGQDRTIVDVGCGTGGNLGAMADGYRCLGIDTSAQAIELAQRRYPRLEFVQGLAPDAIREPLGRASLVMLNDVLEHVPDDFWLLSRLLSAVSPGAYLLLTVPADMNLWSPHDEAFGHYRRYDRQRFARLWEGLDARPLVVSHFNSRLYPLVKTVRVWNRRHDRAAGEAGTDFRIPPAPANGMLRRIFAGEGTRLVDVLRGRRAEGYRQGVSLIAVLRRGYAPIDPRRRPDDVSPDLYAPLDEATLAPPRQLSAGAAAV